MIIYSQINIILMICFGVGGEKSHLNTTSGLNNLVFQLSRVLAVNTSLPDPLLRKPSSSIT